MPTFNLPKFSTPTNVGVTFYAGLGKIYNPITGKPQSVRPLFCVDHERSLISEDLAHGLGLHISESTDPDQAGQYQILGSLTVELYLYTNIGLAFHCSEYISVTFQVRNKQYFEKFGSDCKLVLGKDFLKDFKELARGPELVIKHKLKACTTTPPTTP